MAEGLPRDGAEKRIQLQSAQSSKQSSPSTGPEQDSHNVLRIRTELQAAISGEIDRQLQELVWQFGEQQVLQPWPHSSPTLKWKIGNAPRTQFALSLGRTRCRLVVGYCGDRRDHGRSGRFLRTSDMARDLGSRKRVIAVWVISTVVFFAEFCYAKLGALVARLTNLELRLFFPNRSLVNNRTQKHLFLIQGQCSYCDAGFIPAPHNQTYRSGGCRGNAQLLNKKLPFDKCAESSDFGPNVEVIEQMIVRVFLKNGTESPLVESQFKPMLFRKPFNFCFAISQL